MGRNSKNNSDKGRKASFAESNQDSNSNEEERRKRKNQRSGDKNEEKI